MDDKLNKILEKLGVFEKELLAIKSRMNSMEIKEDKMMILARSLADKIN